MKLDVGGIAKGYASGAAIAVLAQNGITSALVAGSGDIVVKGAPPGLPGWTIGVGPLEAPTAPPRQFLRVKDAAVSTSGDAERFVEIGGKRYSHIVDPHTGVGLVGRMSVTVVAPNGLTSDPLTKVPAVLGPGRGFPVVESFDGASALMTRKTDKGDETATSKRFPKLLDREK